MWEGGTNSSVYGILKTFTGLDTSLYSYALTVDVYATDFGSSSEYVSSIDVASNSVVSFCDPGVDNGGYFYNCLHQYEVTSYIWSNYLDVEAYATSSVNDYPYRGSYFYVRYTLHATSVSSSSNGGGGDSSDTGTIILIVILAVTAFVGCIVAAIVCGFYACKRANRRSQSKPTGAGAGAGAGSGIEFTPAPSPSIPSVLEYDLSGEQQEEDGYSNDFPLPTAPPGEILEGTLLRGAYSVMPQPPHAGGGGGLTKEGVLPLGIAHRLPTEEAEEEYPDQQQQQYGYTPVVAQLVQAQPLAMPQPYATGGVATVLTSEFVPLAPGQQYPVPSAPVALAPPPPSYEESI